VPERYAYLSGTGKLKGTDQKLKKSETRTCLVQMIKWKHQFKNFVPEEEIPISGLIKFKRPKALSFETDSKCHPK